MREVTSLYKYHDARPFPITHLLMPFQFYLVFQHTWFTLLLIYVYESFTALERSICYHWTFCVDAATFECAGANYDNLVADVHNGVLGLFLALLFFTAFDIPRSMPSLRDSVQYKLKNVWWKRLFFGALLMLTAFSNYLGNHIGRAYGTYVYAGSNGLVLLGFYFWNRQQRERRLFWTDPATGKFARHEYGRMYLGGFIITTALILVWLLPIEKTYIKLGIAYAVIWLVLVVYAFFRHRLAQVFDLHTLGLYSAYTQDPKTRFRWNKDRYYRADQPSDSGRIATVADALAKKPI